MRAVAFFGFLCFLLCLGDWAHAQCTVDTSTGFGVGAAVCPDAPVTLTNPE